LEREEGKERLETEEAEKEWLGDVDKQVAAQLQEEEFLREEDQKAPGRRKRHQRLLLRQSRSRAGPGHRAEEAQSRKGQVCQSSAFSCSLSGSARGLRSAKELREVS